MRFRFIQALAIDPNCSDAVLTMVKLDTADKAPLAAATRLREFVELYPRDSNMTKLAVVCRYILKTKNLTSFEG